MTPIILIHGGAGGITKENIPEERRESYREVLDSALKEGYEALEKGSSALDAVEAAILVMEDDPLFNAGKGAVFTHDEKNEMDASIMRGEDRNAGSMAGVSTIKNPIRGARKVMEESEHVMLAGKGAENFAEEVGLEIVDPSYFRTESRLESLRRAKEREKSELDHDDAEGGDGYPGEGKKYGTVGAVALDRNGHLAAGTSTGGMTNKKYGRIGDSPIVGAATYADNNTCAVSATGHGEYFIRNVVAHDIAARMAYLDESVEEASQVVIHEKLEELGGTGGVIVLDGKGRFAMTFNSSGMFRGMKGENEEWVRIFGKEE